jgi:hypothetical protein
LCVDVGPEEATYTLRDGADASLVLHHAGDEVTVHVGQPITRKVVPREPLLPRPEQPVGREPAHRARSKH